MPIGKLYAFHRRWWCSSCDPEAPPRHEQPSDQRDYSNSVDPHASHDLLLRGGLTVVTPKEMMGNPAPGNTKRLYLVGGV